MREGWDVWEIEMTGGPYTDCAGFDDDTCPDYTYDDLVDYYWPALIAGISEYSGKNTFDYIGHSNGCRVALSSLNSYSESGKNNAGYYFDYDTGEYYYSDLPAYSVNKFFGIACPATLNDDTPFTSIARDTGDKAMVKLKGKSHVELGDYVFNNLYSSPWNLATSNYLKLGVLFAFVNSKISYNLMDFYNDLAVNEGSNIDFSDVNVSQVNLYFTTPNDYIVPFQDSKDINESISSLTNENKDITQFEGALHYNHVSIKNRKSVKEKIIEELLK